MENDDVMIDIETLSTEKDALVLSIGVCKFNVENQVVHSGQEWLLNPEEQLAMGRDISMSTLFFWMCQDEAAREQVFGNVAEPMWRDVPAALLEFCQYVSGRNVWSQGKFDIDILENLMHWTAIEKPWKFYQVHDCRSVLKFCGIEKDDYRMGTTHHNALMDAETQARALCEAYRRMDPNL